MKVGNMEMFEEGWFEALKCLAIQKISEATGEPCRLATGGCNADEVFHVVTASGRVFCVCYNDPTDISAMEEVRCPRCGQWVPRDMLDVHEEFCGEEGGGEDGGVF